MAKLSQAAWIERFASHLAALGMRAPRPQLELMALTLWPASGEIRPEIAAIAEFGLWPDHDAVDTAWMSGRSEEDEVWKTLAEGVSLNAECADRLVESAMSKITEAATRPSVLYRPTLSFDGTVWTASYGAGRSVSGIGSTPQEACDAFDAAWGNCCGRHDATDRAP